MLILVCSNEKKKEPINGKKTLFQFTVSQIWMIKACNFDTISLILCHYNDTKRTSCLKRQFGLTIFSGFFPATVDALLA